MTEIEKINLYSGEVVIDYYPTSHRYKKDGQFLLSVSAISGIVDKSNALITWATNLAKDFLLEKMGDQKEITLCEAEIIEACQQHKVKKKEACDIGTMVHNRAEAYAKGENPELPTDEKVKNGVLAFLKWKTDNQVEFLEVERLVYSKKYEYVGRFDLIARVNGKKMLIDYKTSKHFYPMEMGMQTA
jgi:ATP-dependent exoDNAse (exonuclease V) beta subunit